MEGNVNFAVEQVSEKLEKLITAAGGQIEKAWPYLVKQSVIEGWVALITMIFIIIVFACVGLFVFKHWDPEWKLDNKGYSITGSDHEGYWVISLTIIGFIAFLSIIFGIEAVSKILNPEYYAIKDLLSILK